MLWHERNWAASSTACKRNVKIVVAFAYYPDILLVPDVVKVAEEVMAKLVVLAMVVDVEE